MQFLQVLLTTELFKDIWSICLLQQFLPEVAGAQPGAPMDVGFLHKLKHVGAVFLCSSSSSKAESSVPDAGTDVASHTDHLRHSHQQCSQREDPHKSPFFNWQSSLLVEVHTLVTSPNYSYGPSVSLVHLPESCYVLHGSFVFLAGTD